MKKGDYLDAKQEKRKSTSQAIVVLIIFIIVFIAVIFRFAVRSGANGFFSSMPTGSDAYDVSREFIRPTITAGDDADFPEKDFQYSKKSDSVYIVTSYFVTKDNNGQDIKTNFTITLRYDGGAASEKRSWALVSLKEN